MVLLLKLQSIASSEQKRFVSQEFGQFFIVGREEIIELGADFRIHSSRIVRNEFTRTRDSARWRCGDRPRRVLVFSQVQMGENASRGVATRGLVLAPQVFAANDQKGLSRENLEPGFEKDDVERLDERVCVIEDGFVISVVRFETIGAPL